MKTYIKALLMGLVVITLSVAVIAVQARAVTQNIRDVSVQEVTAWHAEHKARNLKAKEIVMDCLANPKSRGLFQTRDDNLEALTRCLYQLKKVAPVSLSEFTSLIQRVHAARQRVEIPAPLSWFL
ncbi:hypothetical protein ACFOY8_12315 [Thalassospira xianhensis]|uniref:Uncharacterized protein n=1 Tax=Thalassospira xianhensis MCCC 1A02616 TaxID=1177929 RepID=A0A367UH18_9PROT|nr:hypothetical protein [Thalassospira xianhensis]RCK06352.1 hypothetical protein TH5_09125 [Thalassospira xianhensis MCCC 1A02616]